MISTALSLTSAARARRRAASVFEIQRGKAVVEDVQVRPLHQRPGDGEPLLLPAGEVGAALGYAGAQAVGQVVHKPAWAMERARCISASSAFSLRSAGCRRWCRKTATPFGAHRQFAPRSACWGRLRMSSPPNSTAPPVTSWKRSSSLAMVDFPLPVLPMMAVVSPRRRAKSSPRRVASSASAKRKSAC